MTERVAIIGAGLGGLTCALALARLGVARACFRTGPGPCRGWRGDYAEPQRLAYLYPFGDGTRAAAVGVVPPKQITQNLHSGAILVERERGPAVGNNMARPISTCTAPICTACFQRHWPRYSLMQSYWIAA